ncbi:PREDICTED: uncharacterized protein LOC104806424 isoform X2 [Tarenaya hassleriana]|uniref:uncharacterized protein LOC104806424 isoform X1 n=1 Tax=Tarenaya hassleriana TaxID=28532 RepID=UPI00053C26F6|nr:PREDICTED: uncharacterized protein LOC104806424 isoform X1 [Tarenaya hassleriana]XP_010529635.1 PREDICTED: uncharacterized protein LOC104806424 isoform X2 [Tarenaya hassleriana]
MRVAVVGGGISGLGSAYVLAREGVEVVLYERDENLGGHAKTVRFDGADVDLGFMIFNRVTYPNMMELFEDLGVDMEVSDMSFSVSLENGGGLEWGSRNGFSSLFAQKSNVFNTHFWQMIREIVKFPDDVSRYIDPLESNPNLDRTETLGQFLNSHGYSELFRKAYLVPICGSIWSCPSDRVLTFPAFSVLSFCRNHQAFQLFGRPQWLTVAGRSHSYVAKVRTELERRGGRIRTSCDVQLVSTSDNGVTVRNGDGSEEAFDRCILATHAPDALRLVGEQATFDERRILGAFQYVDSDIYLHRDKDFMPRNPTAWGAWNFLGSTENKVCLTYWLNLIQNLGENSELFFVTLNPDHTPKKTLLKWTTSHPFPSVSAWTASQELYKIQGKRGLWFCGAYQGYGFHEDGLKAGIAAAQGMLGKDAALLSNPKQMVPSFSETGARLFVTRFMGQFISTGCVILLEDGGTVFKFGGKHPKCSLKSVVKIHSPKFYWKVMTEADLGFSDAYINGDLSFVDKDNGLLNMIMILIANRDLNSSKSNIPKKRGWWTPMFFTAGLSSAKYFLKHVSRMNTLTQARRNISHHYDLSNEFFAMFLDETMTYSSAIFKSDNEDLRTAQMRKIYLLIDKARIGKNHEVLEIGFGWGTFAIEVVRQTGCKYTGITLSVEQLKYAEAKVKEAGLEDRITFQLCDYRQLSDSRKYDRIISIEMLEEVGHEFIETFFNRCESVLAEDGLLVLQTISIPEERYDEYRLSSDFIKEYIFPGGCILSLARITSAMASSSRLCIEQVENIGIHYYRTLRCWRQNLLERQKRIVDLGFDEKFIRTWEYYFDYSAAGFKTLTLGDYQMVFSRPGNAALFGDPYRGFPSARCLCPETKN